VDLDHNPFADRGDISIFTRCRELRELEIVAQFLSYKNLDLISSISSTKIEKIILTRSVVFRFSEARTAWARLDKILVQLVHRSKRSTLEVEFRDVSVTWEGKLNLGKYLPMFVEKGRMTVLDPEGQLIYCSDGAAEGR
jgi:hypothetical protein